MYEQVEKPKEKKNKGVLNTVRQNKQKKVSVTLADCRRKIGSSRGGVTQCQMSITNTNLPTGALPQTYKLTTGMPTTKFNMEADMDSDQVDPLLTETDTWDYIQMVKGRFARFNKSGVAMTDEEHSLTGTDKLDPTNWLEDGDASGAYGSKSPSGVSNMYGWSGVTMEYRGNDNPGHTTPPKGYRYLTQLEFTGQFEIRDQYGVLRSSSAQSAWSIDGWSARALDGTVTHA